MGSLTYFGAFSLILILSLLSKFTTSISRPVYNRLDPFCFSSLYTIVKLAPSSTYSSSHTSLVIRRKAPSPPAPKKVVQVTEMCFGGGSKNDTVVIRKYEKPRYKRNSYVSRPEVSTYRKETVTRRSTSAPRPSYDHHAGRRSGSRIVEERRYYNH